jgi:hypothetical protein
MVRILFGWDNGLGTGYIDRLLQVARALADEGHQPVFAIRDLITPAQRLHQVEWPVFQSPIPVGLLDPLLPTFNPGSFGDLLAVANFNNEVELTRLMKAWDLLLQVIKPDLIVGEYAPLLALAAHRRIPTLLMGHGYILPPPELAQFPIFDYSRTPFTPQDTMLDIVQRVQRARGMPVAPALPAAVGGDVSFVTAYGVTDPYAQMRRHQAVGPLESYAPAPPPAQRRFYAYLSAEYRPLRQILNAIVGARVPGKVYIKRITPQLRQFLVERGVEVLTAPPPLQQAVTEASFVIHHGGMATATAALGIGRPQMLWSSVADQAVTTHAINQLGVADITGLRYANGTDAAQGLQRLAADDGRMARAQAVAHQLHQAGEGNSLGKIVAGARRLLAGG